MLKDHRYGANASHGASVYTSAFTSNKFCWAEAHGCEQLDRMVSEARTRNYWVSSPMAQPLDYLPRRCKICRLFFVILPTVVCHMHIFIVSAYLQRKYLWQFTVHSKNVGNISCHIFSSFGQFSWQLYLYALIMNMAILVLFITVYICH